MYRKITIIERETVKPVLSVNGICCKLTNYLKTLIVGVLQDEATGNKELVTGAIRSYHIFYITVKIWQMEENMKLEYDKLSSVVILVRLLNDDRFITNK